MGILVMRREYTLHGVPVYLWAPFTHTFIPRANLSYTYWRKRTQKNPQLDL